MSAGIRRRLLVGLVILGGLGLVAAGNVQLVRAAFQSQPDCVPHLKLPDQSGKFRAAKSSC